MQSSRRCVAALAAALSVAATHAAGDEPDPVILVLQSTGMAPWTVHAHAMQSNVTHGSLQTAQLEWDFGDGHPGSSQNQIRGFNAAHVYREPGTYTLQLTLIDQDGRVGIAQQSITVLPPQRSDLFVSLNGDDTNDGRAPQTAVASVQRAVELMDDFVALHLRRGDVFPVQDTVLLERCGLTIDAYGAGPRPILRWVGPEETVAPIVKVHVSSEDVLIEDIAFDSIYPPTRETVRAIDVAGQACTIASCDFSNVSYAVRAAGSRPGIMTWSNTADEIGAYFIWGEASDQVHLGNTVAGSVDEHVMRFAPCERVLIAGNDLTNVGKRTIWCVEGRDAWIENNRLAEGPLVFGPRTVDPGEWVGAVVSRNHLSEAPMIIRHGSRGLRIDSNVIRVDDAQAINLWGWDETQQRTVVDVRLLHNTIINLGTSGRALGLGHATQDVLIANNLAMMPNLYSGSGGAANVFVLDSTLGSVVFHDNLWSTPAQVGWGDGWHYRWPYWSEKDGFLDPQEWAALPQTSGERYRNFDSSDLDQDWRPQFHANQGWAVAGVARDFHDMPRSLHGAATVGAVQSLHTPLRGDVNGDGLVNVHDMLQVLSGWGPCPLLDCPHDIDADGQVSVMDLIDVLVDWSNVG